MGVDPGVSGAIAFFFPEESSRIAVFDVPLVDGNINCSQLADIINTYKPDMAVIEMVGSMPGQGVSSTFKFGMAFGMVRGVVGSLMIPQHYVSPAKWKKYFGLAADKEKARELAIRNWPQSEHFRRKKDHGRAEAALLCKYGAEVLKF
jgi:crossover junction endodeoxyribonuclease RuvC